MRQCTVIVVIVLALLTGCATKAGNGALIGGGLGALAGGIIGNNSGGHGGTGALIGAGVGAIGGGLIGHSMDKADKKKEEARYTNDYDRNFDQYGNRR